MTFANAATARAAEINDFNCAGIILEEIEADFDVDLMTSKIKTGSEKAVKLFHELAREAGTLARPKASFTVCRVETTVGPKVYLDNVSFTSQLLRDNLAGLDWAYAYVATEGNEFARWFESLSGARQVLSWPIRYAALKMAEKALVKFIKSTFNVNQLSSMNPGTLKLWPIEQQRSLFDLLDPLPESIGVSLGSECWMSPDLASSGVLFETESRFYNCQLCPLEPCERRKKPNLGPTNGWPNPKNRFGLVA